MKLKLFIIVIFQLFIVYSSVNASYIGYDVASEMNEQADRVSVNTVGYLNAGNFPFLHLFDSYDAKMLVTLDSPTYNFSSYFDNEWAMTDKEVVRYATNGISFKSKGVMRPVYSSKFGNITKWNHAMAIMGTETEIRLWGYFSSVCLPDMVPVCQNGYTKMFYVPSITKNWQYSCHDIYTRFGDVEMTPAEYGTKYCYGGDLWAGFTYYRIHEKFAMLDVEVIDKKEYTDTPKVIKRFQNWSPTEISYSYENTIEKGNVRIDKTTWNHAWSVSVSVETEVGNALVGSSTINVAVGYEGSYTKDVETQSSITSTNTEVLSITLPANTSVTLKQVMAFERQKIRAQICYPSHTTPRPWFGCTTMKVGHFTTKELYLQKTGTGTTGVAHIITGQLCFLGELNLETDSYSSLVMEK